MVRDVLDGKPGPARDIVVLNAAAGLLAAGKCSEPKQAAELAIETIDKGMAATLLQQLIKMSHESV